MRSSPFLELQLKRIQQVLNLKIIIAYLSLHVVSYHSCHFQHLQFRVTFRVGLMAWLGCYTWHVLCTLCFEGKLHNYCMC